MIVKKLLKTSVLYVLVSTAWAFGACNQKAKNEQQAEEINAPNQNNQYDFANPKVIELPTDLDEISGIAYYAKDTSVFAIVDEDAILYKIPLKDPYNVKSWIYEDMGDYEDVALLDSIFYVLKSNGNVYRLEFNENKIHVDKLDFESPGKKKNEFETLYIDSTDKKIHIVCKECAEDNKTDFTIYTYNDSLQNFVADSQLNSTNISKNLGSKKPKALKISGGAVSPLNGDIYLVSSISKSISVYDKNLNFKEVFSLPKKIYKQPEGITFTPEGHIIISNEFAGKGKANLLLIKNKLAK